MMYLEPVREDFLVTDVSDMDIVEIVVPVQLACCVAAKWRFHEHLRNLSSDGSLRRGIQSPYRYLIS
jgi:hypothetical protein